MEKTSLRTALCGNVTSEYEEVTLSGWVNGIRNHGGVFFIDLRDYTGIVQLVADPNKLEDTGLINELRKEYCIEVKGKVRKRAEDLVNKNISTGDVEVVIEKIKLHNKSKTLPFEIGDRKVTSDDLKLKYRYLDLRSQEMQRKIRNRSKAMQKARQYLSEKEEFAEIETPVLVRSTPEGARDFIVPSRVNKHHFYALPQAPQLYKQLLMVANFDRYFQFARCFRDEDLRSDRQPEFTQLDIEMSFVEKEDVFRVVEGVVREFCKAYNVKAPDNFNKITYQEAMDKYSIDRPDMRFELYTHNVSDIVEKSDFKVFKEAIEKGGIVKCINPDKDFSRKEIDAYTEQAKKNGAKGLAWVKVRESEFEGPISKFLSKQVQEELRKKLKPNKDSTIFFVADEEETVHDIISGLRLKLGHDLNLIEENKFEFTWVVDFPLFERTSEGHLTPSHHMFTMPQKDSIGKLKAKPEEALSEQYDLVLNGFEIAGGSIRNHRIDIQKQIMEIIGFPEEKARERFGFLLDAFEYGAPPHGGIAFGFDRVCALLSGLDDIREVMSFPKNKKAQNPMDESPSVVDEEQLKELHIKLR